MGNTCFYCEKTLRQTESKIEVDHFVPWSFIHSDDLWNFALSCRNCNNNKRDKLPVVQYLDELIKQNRMLVKLANPIIISEMRCYQEQKLVDLCNGIAFL